MATSSMDCTLLRPYAKAFWPWVCALGISCCDAQPTPPPAVRWSVALHPTPEENIALGPFLCSRGVVSSFGAKELRCYDLNTGNLVYSAALPEPLANEPFPNESIVVWGDSLFLFQPPRVLCISLRKGTWQWLPLPLNADSYGAFTPGLGLVAFCGATLQIHGENGWYALGRMPSLGSWSGALSGAAPLHPAFGGVVAIAQQWNAPLQRGKTGILRWNAFGRPWGQWDSVFPGLAAAHPVVVSKERVFLLLERSVVSFRWDTQKVEWVYPLSSTALDHHFLVGWMALSPDESQLWVKGSHASLYALRVSTGQLEWEESMAGWSPEGRPWVDSSGLMYIAEGTLWKVHTSGVKTLVNGSFTGKPVRHKELVFLRDGKRLYAYAFP